MDLPCCTGTAIQENFKKKIFEVCDKKLSSDEDIEIVKILAPLADNPNAPDKYGHTPLHWGHTSNDGDTPILRAAFYGHTEIVKILAPFPKLHFISEFQSRVNDK